MSEIQSVMSKETHILNKVAEEGKLITKLGTELSYLKMLEDNSLIKDGKSFRSGYEERQLRDIKNAITNIYLMLDLHEVKGMCDGVYNKNFEF